MNKQNIFDNIEQYSTANLVDLINQGVVTFEELISETEGMFDAAKRKEVKRLLKSGDDDAWQAALQAHTLEAVQKYLDTYLEGKHREDARTLMRTIQKELQRGEQDGAARQAWNETDKNSLDALRDFVRNYPNCPFISEANKLINQIITDSLDEVGVESLVSLIKEFQTDGTKGPEQRQENILVTVQRFINERKITKSELLQIIAEDNNQLSAWVVKRLIDEGYISIESLFEIGIDKIFVKRVMKDQTAKSFPKSERLERINKQSTEVYFWGIPSSGKSCALGAILSVASNGKVARSMDPDTGSQGFGYMTKLINLFNEGEVGKLMEGTAIDAFYEMGFDLYDNNNKVHPITCIDMAGELMRCMYKENANDQLKDKEVVMLDTMTRILIDNRSVNRKIHVFVIEYGAEDRLYEGLPQKVYLNGAVSYIKNTGVFKKDTDAVYIMISKADKVKNATPEVFKRYIEEKYLGFYNGLEQICKANYINGGKVEMIAFSLGEVCFQNYCRFDPRPAENFVRELLKRTIGNKTGKMARAINLFKR